MKIQQVRAFEMRLDPPLVPERRTAPRSSYWQDVTEVAGPMSRYPRYKARRTSWRPSMPPVGCVITADDGTWGFGATRYGLPVASLINQHLGPLVVGEDCTATEKVWDMLARGASPYSPAGLTAYAVSAIDLALWDLKGKLLGQPVYALLGGPVRESLPCYATGNDVEWNRELGFRAMKLACPYGPADGLDGLEWNEALVARTRETCGPQVDLMLDCWMALDVEYAARLAERLRPYSLRWMEDCLTPEQLDAHITLRQRLPWQSLATGEHWYMLAPFSWAAAHQVVDIFQPDLQWVGGLTAVVKISHLAEAAGIPVIPHAAMNDPFGQHAAFGLPNIPLGEVFMGSAAGVPLDEAPNLPGTVVPCDGRVTLPDGPGFGLRIDRDWLERAAL